MKEIESRRTKKKGLGRTERGKGGRRRCDMMERRREKRVQG